jgi:hypothetical protein
LQKSVHPAGSRAAPATTSDSGAIVMLCEGSGADCSPAASWSDPGNIRQAKLKPEPKALKPRKNIFAPAIADRQLKAAAAMEQGANSKALAVRPPLWRISYAM